MGGAEDEDEDDLMTEVFEAISEAEEVMSTDDVEITDGATREIVAFLLLYPPRARLRILSQFCSACGDIRTSDHRCDEGGNEE